MVLFRVWNSKQFHCLLKLKENAKSRDGVSFVEVVVRLVHDSETCLFTSQLLLGANKWLPFSPCRLCWNC